MMRLHKIFNRTYQVGVIPRFLAEVPVPLLIVTTNYDHLIEQSFQAKGRLYHLVVHPTESKELAGSVLWWKPGEAKPTLYPPAKLPLSVTDTAVIYKMHGSVDRQAGRWDSFVITEEDYVDLTPNTRINRSQL